MSLQGLEVSEVRRWLEGQEEAARRIREERVRFLRSLRPRQSLALYLALWETGGRDRREPSALLLKMRHCLRRWYAHAERPPSGPP